MKESSTPADNNANANTNASTVMNYSEFSELCFLSLELLMEEEDLAKLNTEQNRFSLQRMLGFFEMNEEYEACQDLQDLSMEIFGERINPIYIDIIYES